MNIFKEILSSEYCIVILFVINIIVFVLYFNNYKKLKKYKKILQTKPLRGICFIFGIHIISYRAYTYNIYFGQKEETKSGRIQYLQ